MQEVTGPQIEHAPAALEEHRVRAKRSEKPLDPGERAGADRRAIPARTVAADILLPIWVEERARRAPGDTRKPA